MRARILPDGLISIRRYPLSAAKRFLQYTRTMRRLFAPELKYQCFGGDRIGSDAPFCDRVYVLPGLPHEYVANKVCMLPPLVSTTTLLPNKHIDGKRALVVGQPLVGTGLLKESDLQAVTDQMSKWLTDQGITQVEYKAHPKDPRHDLRCPDYQLIEPSDALESYLASRYYDAIIGVRSSALLFARQIYPSSVEVVAFGWDRINFKSKQEQEDMRKAFDACGVRFA